MTKKQHKLELKAEKRTVSGGKLNQLRAEGVLPAVLYGKGMQSVSVQVKTKDFMKAFKEAGESTLVYLSLDGKSYPTVINDVARDPLRYDITHADFYKVSLDEKIKKMIPVEFVGEAPAVKDFGGIFVRNINELEVEAFPQDLPHEIVIDISGLKNLGDQIQVKDVKLDSKVTLHANVEDILGLIQEPKSQEELDAELAAPTADVSAVEEIKKEEKVEETEEEEAK